MLEMESAGRTDVGRHRTTNQDHFLIADLRKRLAIRSSSLEHGLERLQAGRLTGHVLLVADGMGGHAGGREASSLAVEVLVDYVLNIMPWFLALSPRLDEDAEEELRRALGAADTMVRRRGDEIPDLDGMGTTLTAACVVGPRVYVVHAGDSRCYLLRDGRLVRITRDHTMAQELIERGALQPDEAKGISFSHVLTNAIGGKSAGVRADVYKSRLRPGDLLLLTTDGLTNHLSDEELAQRLAARRPVATLCEELVDAANAAGGKDNITAVVARFYERASVTRPGAAERAVAGDAEEEDAEVAA